MQFLHCLQDLLTEKVTFLSLTWAILPAHGNMSKRPFLQLGLPAVTSTGVSE